MTYNSMKVSSCNHLDSEASRRVEGIAAYCGDSLPDRGDFRKPEFYWRNYEDSLSDNEYSWYNPHPLGMQRQQ